MGYTINVERQNFLTGAKMSVTIETLIQESRDLAKKLSHKMVTIDHLAYVTLQVKSIREFFEAQSYEVLTIEKRILNGLNSITVPNVATQTESINIHNVLMDIKKEAIIQQLKDNDVSVEPFFILLECLSFSETIFSKVLESVDSSAAQVATELNTFMNERNFSMDSKSIQEEMGEEQDAAISRGRSTKSAVEEYTTDLTQEARDGKLDPLIGRAVELHDMVQVLSRKTKKNVTLVGDAGVGKTQVVNGFAHLIAQGNVPDNLKDVRLLSLNMASLLAGTKFRGDFEGRIDRLVKEIKENPNYILFIDEIHTMMGAGSSGGGGTDMSNMLKPALSKGDLRVIGATTYDEYRKHFEKDPALSRRFMKLDILEPTLDETRQIITGLKKTYEKFHGAKFPRATIEAVLELSSKYLKTKKFPDKAIDLMDAAGARNKVRDVPNGSITRADIEYEVSRIANLSLEIVACQESERMKNLESNLHKSVYGQDEAIRTLVKNVLVARAGLRDKASIQGAFLFVGPSGTGKTEISKALSNSLGLELIRFDMSEYAQEHTVAKLIGAPPGYVGHDAGNGALLDRVEQFPNSVLLLDEIEKAHPKVLQTLLSLLDEGRLTGSHGKTVYFNNVTVIMTSNLGARNSDVRAVGFGGKGGKDGIDSAVREKLAPEFINRLDAIVKFNELSTEAIESIVDKFIDIINEDNKDRKVKVILDAAAKSWLAEHGVEKGMGARPMKRVINEHIKVPLAQEILFGYLVNGGKAKFTVKDNQLVLVMPKLKAEPKEEEVEETE